MLLHYQERSAACLMLVIKWQRLAPDWTMCKDACGQHDAASSTCNFMYSSHTVYSSRKHAGAFKESLEGALCVLNLFTFKLMLTELDDVM
jgi:hypothetical protein